MCRVRQDIPRQAVKDKSRLLRKMEAEAAEKARVEREKTVTKKYHKVRFVDRTKVTRKLERVEKQIRAAQLDESVSGRHWRGVVDVLTIDVGGTRGGRSFGSAAAWDATALA